MSQQHEAAGPLVDLTWKVLKAFSIARWAEGREADGAVAELLAAINAAIDEGREYGLASDGGLPCTHIYWKSSLDILVDWATSAEVRRNGQLLVGAIGVASAMESWLKGEIDKPLPNARAPRAAAIAAAQAQGG